MHHSKLNHATVHHSVAVQCECSEAPSTADQRSLQSADREGGGEGGGGRREEGPWPGRRHMHMYIIPTYGVIRAMVKWNIDKILKKY